MGQRRNQKEIRKYFETSKKQIYNILNLMSCKNSAQRKFMAVNAYIKKEYFKSIT